MINKAGVEVVKPKGAVSIGTKIKGVMRSDVLKFMMQLPLKEFAKKNRELKEYVELNFQNPDEFTVEMGLAYQNIAKLIMNPNAKDYSYIQAEVYGKVKEESNTTTIELPPMQDITDLLETLDTQTLERILSKRKEVPQLETPFSLEEV